MPFLFALSIFAAAALVFLLEPLVGKLLLPTFGGAPAVWNVCMAFFQTVLLAAYAYAHWLTRWPRPRAQFVCHLVVLTLTWLALPFSSTFALTPRGGSDPTGMLVAQLCLTAGVPFFAVAATSPLLAQWFAASGHRHASDPYYLYAASNAGSLLGLLAYPALVEPRWTLPEQSRVWAAGYALFMAMLVGCIAVAWRRRSVAPDQLPGTTPNGESPSWLLKLTWLSLAFVPSSLLLGVTAFLSSDVSPVPLIWVVPLALYLLSFVVAFSRLPTWLQRVWPVALPLLVMGQIYQSFTGARFALWQLAGLHLATFFAAAMLCHGELARRRPPATQLTQFYFWMSLGGVLGGMFNALVAPLLFRSLAEYPLAMSAACLCSPLTLWRWPRGRGWLDLPLAAITGLLAAVILFKSYQYDWEPAGPILICLLLCGCTFGRPLAFGFSIAALFLVVGFFHDVTTHVIFRQRDFYGVLTVQTDVDDEFYYLTHGRIRHGQQRRSDDPTLRDVPLIYYYPTGPIGQVFAAPPTALKRRLPVAAVGLGVGSLASYGKPGQKFVFYEIDPAVEQIARNDTWFTYLRDSRADVRVVLGDARLSLRDAPAGHYGLMVIDAFSGDAIPVHLLTHEAMQLYLSKLAPDGVLAFHISNNFLDLAPVLGNLASASELIGLHQNETGESINDDDLAAGKSESHWVILARHDADFGPLSADARWRPLASARELPLWTDHSTSLWRIAHWRQ